MISMSLLQLNNCHVKNRNFINDMSIINVQGFVALYVYNNTQNYSNYRIQKQITDVYVKGQR